MNTAVLEADGLCRDYRLTSWPRRTMLPAARDVSFQLHERRVVALVGESGSGKSTVARLLAGQDKATRGTIRLDGTPVDLRRSRDYRAYKGDVQMIFQDPFASLNPTHTVCYHLQRPLRLRGIRGKDAEGQRDSLLEQVRLSPPGHYLAKFPHELSGGQRQRVAIARALAAGPRVLLADEPVSMLDVSIRLEILSLLDTLRQRLGLAILYITHDIASARYFADEILVMYSGEIVERGSAEQVTQQPAHPYTQLLIESSPDPDAFGSPRPAGLPAQPGGRKAISRPQHGCPFSPRCPVAEARCQTAAPPQALVQDGHTAACWRLDATVTHT